MTRLALFVIAATSALVALPRASRADIVNLRGGLGNTFSKLARGERVVIAYFGGSITAGAGASKPDLCYRELLTSYLRGQFPKADIQPVDAAIGGTGSWLGAFRVGADVLSLNPDLVVVEYAVNDGGAPEQQVYASMEGIVRQIWAANAKKDILFVYTMVAGHMAAYERKSLPDTVAWDERIAERYGIPSVNMAQYAAGKIIAKELTFDEFAKDGVHPTDRGYALYLDALKPLVAQCKAAPAADPKPHPMPAPIGERPMDHAKLVSYELATHDTGWKPGQPNPAGIFPHVIACDQPGPILSLKFKGDRVGYYNALGPDSGDIEVSIDGAQWQPRPDFDQWAKDYYRPRYNVVAEGLDPAATHEVRLRVAPAQPKDSKGRVVRIGYFLVNGEAVSADPYAGMTELQRIDAIYATIPPVAYRPPVPRRTYIPRTMKRPRDGGILRLVLLGDSIVNDTSHSQFELLLQRAYPKCRIEKTTSVRGSTGCWWYKEENRVQEWVLDHKPDLLMIGGISNREDVDSIREVIHQVRAKSDTEIVVMTGAVGPEQQGDPRKNPAWRYDVDPNGTDYRARLLRMANEEKVEFLDMTGPWGQYVKDSGLACSWFMRDVVHANDRGFQVLGRILERWFAP